MLEGLGWFEWSTKKKWGERRTWRGRLWGGNFEVRNEFGGMRLVAQETSHLIYLDWLIPRRSRRIDHENIGGFVPLPNLLQPVAFGCDLVGLLPIGAGCCCRNIAPVGDTLVADYHDFLTDFDHRSSAHHVYDSVHRNEPYRMNFGYSLLTA